MCTSEQFNGGHIQGDHGIGNSDVHFSRQEEQKEFAKIFLKRGFTFNAGIIFTVVEEYDGIQLQYFGFEANCKF